MQIRKFREAMDFGRFTNRVAYAAEPAKLPEPVQGAKWREDASFRPEEIPANSELARVIDHAREHGFATLERDV
jgi:hypothetical protein